MRNRITLICILLLTMQLIRPLNVLSQDFKSKFIDTTDNSFDVSNWLIQKQGFLPIPSIVTEPAVGYGIAGGLLFFHSSFSDKKGPPSISGVGGAYTENGTWAAGLFHAGFWKDDNIRYVGAFFRVNSNVDFYGSGGLGIIENPSVQLNMDAWLLLQQLKFRIAESNFFIGGRYFLFDTDNTFKIPINIPEFNGIEFSSTLSEVSAILNYESRNNVFTPTKGLYVEISGTYSDKWMAGAGQYGRLGNVLLGFIPIEKRFNLGLRFESIHTLGNVPFWARPIVSMRGVPAMKYQGKHVSLIEMELSYNVYNRWFINTFAGVGNAYADMGSFNKGKTVKTIGTGFRYEIARLFGVRMGADFAWSQDDFAFYIMFGHAWMR